MKSRPQPGQAEVRAVEWLQLLQLPVHLGDLQGLVVEELILLGEGGPAHPRSKRMSPTSLHHASDKGGREGMEWGGGGGRKREASGNWKRSGIKRRESKGVYI